MQENSIDILITEKMTDAELNAWWPDFGLFILGLRRCNQPAMIERLLDAVAAGATSGEILCGIGCVLDEYKPLRARLDTETQAAWQAVEQEVNRAYPAFPFLRRLFRLK